MPFQVGGRGGERLSKCSREPRALQADSHRAAVAVRASRARKACAREPRLRNAPKSLRVSRATIGRGTVARTKRGTVSQAQIADVMGYGQLGSNVRCLQSRNAESLPAQGPSQISCAQHHGPSEYVKCLGSYFNSEAPDFGHHQ